MSDQSHHRRNTGNSDSNNPPEGDEVLGTLGSARNAPMLGDDNTPPAEQTPSGSGDRMGDLFGSLFGTAGGSGGQGVPSGVDPLGSLLGGLLGGGGQAGGQSMDDPIGGLLGGLLGGSAPSGMGGMGGNMGALGGVLSPLADMISDKTGIPRDTAMAAMAIIIPMVMNKLMQSGHGGDPMSALSSMNSGQGLDFSHHEHSEMVRQLSTQTGMDQQQAADTLNQTLAVLSHR